MGRAHTFTTSASVAAATATHRPPAVLRVLDVLVGGVLLILALPVIGVLALAVTVSSNGPVLHRDRTRDKHGRAIELLTFRTALDGAGTLHHARLRAVVGAQATTGVTGVGRVMRATRADRLPRLINLLRGDTSLF